MGTLGEGLQYLDFNKFHMQRQARGQKVLVISVLYLNLPGNFFRDIVLSEHGFNSVQVNPKT